MVKFEPTKVQMDEGDFYITPFGAFKAANISGELATTLAPLLSSFIPLAGVLDSDKPWGEALLDMNTEDLVKSIAASMSEGVLDGDKVESLMKKLLLGGHIGVEYEDEDGDTQRDELNQKLADALFCGRAQDMFILCIEVIKLNFSGFFESLADQLGLRDTKMKATSRLTETSTKRSSEN